jgi:hypothetical protein
MTVNYEDELRYKELVGVLGSVHHNKIKKKKLKKMQQCIKLLLFRIYVKLKMFRATHRPSSGT